MLPAGIVVGGAGAVVGGGGGVLFSNASTLFKRSSIMEQASKGQNKMMVKESRYESSFLSFTRIAQTYIYRILHGRTWIRISYFRLLILPFTRDLRLP